MAKLLSLDSYLNLVPLSKRCAFIQDLMHHEHALNLSSYDVLRLCAQYAPTMDLLENLTDSELLILIKELFIRFDEGSYAIICLLKDSPCYPIIQGLLDHRYHIANLNVHVSIKEALSLLEKHFCKGVELCYQKLQIPFSKEQFFLFCQAFGIHYQSFPGNLGMYELSKLEAPILQKLYQEIDHFLDLDHLRSNFEKLIIVLPTADRDLQTLPFIPSVLAGMYRHSPYARIDPTLCPLIVIDQSCPDLYQKNALFLATLNHPIIHLSGQEAARLGKEHQIDALFVPQHGHRFGYGGARNAALLLGPILTKRSPLDCKVLVGEDDMLMPESDFLVNLISMDCAHPNESLIKPFTGRVAYRSPCIAWPFTDEITKSYAGALVPPQKLSFPHPYGAEEHDILTPTKECLVAIASHHLATSRLNSNHVITYNQTLMAVELGYQNITLCYSLPRDPKEFKKVICDPQKQKSKIDLFWQSLPSKTDRLLGRIFCGQYEKDLLRAFCLKAKDLYSIDKDLSLFRNELSDLAYELKLNDKPIAYAYYTLCVTFGTLKMIDDIRQNYPLG